MTTVREMISQRTRVAFREALAASEPSDVCDIFRMAGFSRKIDWMPWETPQELVNDYYATADFGAPNDVRMTLAAYSEILHRLDAAAVEPLVGYLEQDGFVRDSDGRFKPIPGRHNPLLTTLADLAGRLDYPRLAQQVYLLVEAAEANPELAVGTAKETIETVCKTILEERGVQPGTLDIGKLVRRTAEELALLPDAIPDKARGVETIRRLLSNLAQISQGLGELRNLYGTGHGRAARDQSVRPRHARLAVNSAATLATFLVETHLQREGKEGQRREGRST